MNRVREIPLGLTLGAVIVAALIFAGVHVELVDRTKLWYEGWAVEARKSLSLHGFARVLHSPVARGTSETELPKLDFNPFIRGPNGKNGEIRYHPLLELAGAYGTPPSPKDFFGFRNYFDAYFDPPGRYRYVIMTGNSELAGFLHPKTIAEYLEDILRERTHANWRVVNFGMNGATTSNEMTYFVDLGYRLHPAIVISHSMWTDLWYAATLPPQFRDLGLLIQDNEIKWNKILHAGNFDPIEFEKFDQIAKMDPRRGIVEAYFGNLEEYKTLVEASGARFIAGLQLVQDGAHLDPSGVSKTEIMQMIASFLQQHKTDIEMVDFNKLNERYKIQVTGMHTDAAGARTIAEIYADEILKTR